LILRGKKGKRFRALKEKLEYHYARYDKTAVSPDPIDFPRRFGKPENIELAAFLSSVFAYGNVKAILRALDFISDLLGENPYDALVSEKSGLLARIRKSGLRYRFYSNEDIARLFEMLKRAYGEFGSLENLFMKSYEPNAPNLRNEIELFNAWFLNECEKANCSTRGFRFMFPQPSKGSAVKRMNLFLRWMVRKDEIDFGLWRGIPKNRLVIPLDVHVARISRELGLTKRNDNGWKTAVEITETLKLFDENDPIKYDFALCHIGMRKEVF
jgi:uncharacterized protein (TIGR02757 family)